MTDLELAKELLLGTNICKLCIYSYRDYNCQLLMSSILDAETVEKIQKEKALCPYFKYTEEDKIDIHIRGIDAKRS